MKHTLSTLTEKNSDDAFSLQNERLLKVRLDKVSIQAKAGSMVAYQGEVRFEHQGGGAGRLVKKFFSGEGTRLMKAEGSGEVFLAFEAQFVHLLQLENEKITINGQNVLAFDAGIDWDIEIIKGGVAGVAAGGLTNMTLSGNGWVAVTTDGPPIMLDVADAPTYVDPSAAVMWSDGVTTNFKTDVQLKTFVGLGSGESLQIAFEGAGWVMVQPSEGTPVPSGS